MKAFRIQAGAIDTSEISENWSLNPDEKPFDKVYWLTKKGETFTVNGDTYEVRRDQEGVAPFEDPIKGAQAVLLKNGKPEHDRYNNGKRYVKIAELENNEAVIAFLPAMNII